jgi:hypothetical protein
MSDGKVLTEVKYRDLADLIFILQEQACEFLAIDKSQEELTVSEFTDWLCSMKGSVELIEYIPMPKG